MASENQSILDILKLLKKKNHWNSLVLLSPASEWYYELSAAHLPVVIVATEEEIEREFSKPLRQGDLFVRLPYDLTSMDELYHLSIALAVAEGALSYGDRILALGKKAQDNACFIIDAEISQSSFSELHSVLMNPNLPDRQVIKTILTLALEIGHMRKRSMGALYVIGDADNVQKNCSQLFMDPFEGKPVSKRNIMDRDVRDTLKEYARLDGAVIIDGEGVIRAAGVCINADTQGVDLLVEGTRHAAAAAISVQTDAISITVSETTGTVMLFKKGKPILKVAP